MPKGATPVTHSHAMQPRAYRSVQDPRPAGPRNCSAPVGGRARDAPRCGTGSDGGDTEVADLDARTEVGLGCQEHVGRLDVAVHHAAGVGVGEGIEHRAEGVLSLGPGCRRVAIEGAQRGELHGQVGLTLGKLSTAGDGLLSGDGAVVEDQHHAPMGQAGDGLYPLRKAAWNAPSQLAREVSTLTATGTSRCSCTPRQTTPLPLARWGLETKGTEVELDRRVHGPGEVTELMVLVGPPGRAERCARCLVHGARSG